jgi:peptidoglycan hydrolase-like protein with peptidoglycan-binding domain
LIWNQSIGRWVSDSLTPIWPATPTGPQVIRQLRQWRSPFRSSATRSALGATLTGSDKWVGGVLGPDGKIYGIPYNSTDILIIDPVAGTATRSALGATLTDSDKWVGGVLGPDGKIYGIPLNSTDILIIDPVAGTATRSALGATLTDSVKWYGGVLGPDGKIYGIPYFNATDILIINNQSKLFENNLTLSPYLNKL